MYDKPREWQSVRGIFSGRKAKVSEPQRSPNSDIHRFMSRDFSNLHHEQQFVIKDEGYRRRKVRRKVPRVGRNNRIVHGPHSL